MTRFDYLENLARERGYTLYRGTAKGQTRDVKPAGYVLWLKRGTWTFYRTLSEVEARIQSGR